MVAQIKRQKRRRGAIRLQKSYYGSTDKETKEKAWGHKAAEKSKWEENSKQEGRCNMSKFINSVKAEITRLDGLLKSINEIIKDSPEGCLKWKCRNENIYYYRQHLSTEDKENKWTRKYIKKQNLEIATRLAEKQYYNMIKPILEKQLQELKRFINLFPNDKTEEIYDSLCPERKNLFVPINLESKKIQKNWLDEKYEQTTMYSENLKYETEQGEIVRSKSELIIANLLYQNKNHLLYKYERPLEVKVDGKRKIIYPDFSILNIHTGKIKYWEHAGKMDDSGYANEFVRKINTYSANGLLPGRDVLFTFETSEHPLDIKNVKRIVTEALMEDLI